MPGTHNDETRLLGFYAAMELADRIDEARATMRLTRSQFLREAVVALVESRGVHVPEHLRFAPDRAGKGGPKKKSSTTARRNRPGVARQTDVKDQQIRDADPADWENGGIDPKTGELSSEVNAAVLGLVKKAADEAANNPPVVFGRKRRAG